MTDLTIAFPVFNEAGTMRKFLQAVDESCASLVDRYRIQLLVVDDGCTDDTVVVMRQTPLQRINRIQVVHLSRNMGHPRAVQCAVQHMDAPLNILMDADFQDDPMLIPQLVQRQETTGADLVRVSRKGYLGHSYANPLVVIFRVLFRVCTGGRDSFGTFGLYTIRVIEALKSYSLEAHYYFPGIVNLAGFNSVTLNVERNVRQQGTSRMGVLRLIRVGLDALFSFSTLPIRLASLLGLVIMMISMVGIGVIMYIRIFTTLAIPGWSSVLAVLTFYGGIQLLFLGILGEYISRIFEQVKRRPNFFVASNETFSPTAHEPAAR